LLLRRTESLLVAAASGDVDLDRLGEITGMRPVERGAGWLGIDRSWIQLDAIRELLADALPAPPADPDDLASWQRQPVIADGRDPAPPGQQP
jgi:hypothetical protein